MTNHDNPKTKASRVGTGFLYAALVFFLISVIALITSMSQSSWSALIPMLFAIFSGLISLILALIGLILKINGEEAR